MKKRFSDEQIISISARPKPGFLPVSSAVSTPFPTPSFTPRRKKYGGMEVLRLSALSRFEEENARPRNCLPKPCWIRGTSGGSGAKVRTTDQKREAVEFM